MLDAIKGYIAAAGIVVVVTMAGVIIGQFVLVDRLRAELRQEQANAALCASANAASRQAIAGLEEERSRAGRSREERLAEKDAVIKKLRGVIAAGGRHEEREGASVVSGADGDGMLALLSGMLPAAGDGGADGVRAGAGAAASAGAGLSAGVVGYCLDEVNAARLAANVAMLRGWALDMRTILATYNSGTGEQR